MRPIEIARAGWGLALLVAPGPVLRNFHGVRVDRRSLVVARVLGARHLTQAVLSGVDPSPEVLAMGVWVDTAHGASAVGLAAVDHSRVRGGLLDAGLALTWALAGYRALRRPDAQSPRHDRRRDALARKVLRYVPGGRRLQLAAGS
nr:hypothetical protein [Nakamurella flava]